MNNLSLKTVWKEEYLVTNEEEKRVLKKWEKEIRKYETFKYSFWEKD